MLRTIIIGADADLGRSLGSLLNETGRYGVLRATEDYPEGMGLERLLRAHAPHVIFLCVDHLQSAMSVRDGIDSTVPGIPLVAFGRSAGQSVLLELMKVGVREFLPAPFEHNRLYELADRLEQRLSENPLSFDTTDLMFSFLPAKAGVGTSTLALNISLAMSAQTKVLLADFDLNSGLIAFMLKISSAYSLVDAAERSGDMDENLWPQLVAEAGDLHVLPSGRTEPGVRIDPAQIRHLISFARRQYGVICVDLSGNMERYSVELMQESKQIFLVTTPEVPPLHLARERNLFLQNIDLGDRVSVLLNRRQRRSAISVAQIEDLLELPVYESFPNDYQTVHDAVVSGKAIDRSSDLGSACHRIAARILDPEGRETQKKKKKRFIEHFAVIPSR